MGHTPFNVASTVSTGVQSVVVTFDAPPDPALATRLASYSITDPNALDLSGTPQLSGSSVTLTTSSQSAVDYDLDVFSAPLRDCASLRLCVRPIAGRPVVVA